MNKRLYFLVILLNVIIHVSFAYTPFKEEEQGNEFEKFIVSSKKYPILKKVLKQKSIYKPQIIFSPYYKRSGTSIYFIGNQEQYYYPGTLMNLPMSYLLYKFMPFSNMAGLTDSTYVIVDKKNIDCAFSSNDAYKDTTKYRAKFIHLFQAMLALKDKQAFNIAFELVGLNFIDKLTNDRVIENIKIQSKIGLCDTNDLRVTGPVFYVNLSDPETQKMDSFFTTFPYFSDKFKFTIHQNATIGKSHFLNNSLVKQPLDMSYLNYVPLYSFHEFLVKMFFVPQAGPEFERIRSNINLFLGQWNNQVINNDFKKYNKNVSSTKYFFSNITTENIKSIQKDYKVYNISSAQQGFLNDCSFIINENKNLKYLLSASIYCNKDDIANDNTYEYNTIGYAFMQELRLAAEDFILLKSKK